MKEEFTEAMFEEFAISPREEICVKASCVWEQLDWDAPKEKVTEMAKWYGITYKQAMKWKV